MAEVNLVSIGVIAIVVGLVLVFVGILLQSKGNAKIEGGGIVFIGPFPIIGGATSERALYVLLAVSVVFFILFFIMNYVRQ